MPHVEARNRLFVLAPLSDLAPGLVPPGWGETVAAAARRPRDLEGPDAARPIATWDGEGWDPLGSPADPSRGQIGQSSRTSLANLHGSGLSSSSHP